MLSLIISEALWERHPDEPEGVLTARRAAIVSARGLARIAARIDLGDYLLLGQGAERSGERRRGSVLASTFEAVVAAVYLDGGLDVARALSCSSCAARSSIGRSPPWRSSRPRAASRSCRYAASRSPTRRTAWSPIDGPDHERRYEVEVLLDGVAMGTGDGPQPA